MTETTAPIQPTKAPATKPTAAKKAPGKAATKKAAIKKTTAKKAATKKVAPKKTAPTKAVKPAPLALPVAPRGEWDWFVYDAEGNWLGFFESKAVAAAWAKKAPGRVVRQQSELGALGLELPSAKSAKTRPQHSEAKDSDAEAAGSEAEPGTEASEEARDALATGYAAA